MFPFASLIQASGGVKPCVDLWGRTGIQRANSIKSISVLTAMLGTVNTMTFNIHHHATYAHASPC